MILKSYVKMHMCRQRISHPRWSFYLFMSLKFSHLFLFSGTGSVCSQPRSPGKTFRVWFTAESMRCWWSTARGDRCCYSPKISNRYSLNLSEKNLRTSRSCAVVHCFLCRILSLPQANCVARYGLDNIHLYLWKRVESEDHLCGGARVTTIY